MPLKLVKTGSQIRRSLNWKALESDDSLKTSFVVHPPLLEVIPQKPLRATMRTSIKLCILFGIFAISHGSDSNELETFIESVIVTWQLRSPTVLVKYDLPNMCMSQNQQWILCLSNDQDANELANHLASIHQRRKQDGLIFVGSQGHGELLQNLSEDAPSIWTSNNPIFMPFSYKNDIQLRLDSNILFYVEHDIASYELYDIFAVKGGPSTALEVGKWSLDDGVMLIKSMNRWERRTNLQKTTFVNCFANNPGWAEFTEEKNDTKGYFQDMLF